MNREQVKKRLLGLRKTDEDFEVIFSGKKSRKVDGLYKPASREIILHTGNFTTDDELVYTAIHEYAHHLQFTDLGGARLGPRPTPPRSGACSTSCSSRRSARASTTARSRASPSSRP